MKSFERSLFVALLFACFSSLCVFAQEKSLLYYDSHEKEILPDAQIAFKDGNYERAVLLCGWHSTIVGDNKADSLREKSERCAKLSKEMNDLKSEGQIKEAKLKASAILSLNPDDAAAKAVLLIEEAISPVPDTVLIQPADTLVVTPPDKGEVEPEVEQQPGLVNPPVEIAPATPDTIEPDLDQASQATPYEPHTRFVIKAGASILDLNQMSQSIAPGAAIGIYDLGGSRIGGEIGVNMCSSLSASTASLFGVDAALVFRAAKNIYPKLGIGFFSCKSTEVNDSTMGMCAGAGLSFLVGGHFCLELGTKYYPKVCVQGTETVSTTPGASYEFPSVKQILPGGIAPFVSLGWAF
jgi:hypothetical protein